MKRCIAEIDLRLARYELRLVIHRFMLHIRTDSERAFGILKEEYQSYLAPPDPQSSNDYELVDIFIYYADLRRELTYHRDLVFYEYEFGKIIVPLKIPNTGYCFYSGPADRELFRLVVLKTLVKVALEKGIPVIHGSLINYRDKGFTFIGFSGAGKSSLAAGLVLKYEAKFITDDGYLLDNKAQPTGYGFCDLTGIDYKALRSLEISLNQELLPNMDNIFEDRKRKVIPIHYYRRGTMLPSTPLHCAIFLVPEKGGECWSRLLTEPEKRDILLERGFVRYNRNIPAEREIQQLIGYFDKIPGYLFGISNDYLKNLDYLYTRFLCGEASE